ncbi:unnamed protein product [Jaminaea pallidilutea]
MASTRTYGLVTVKSAPERVRKVICALIENVKDRYNIVHAGNSENVPDLLRSVQPPPSILCCASMWTPEQHEHIQRKAREVIPGIKTHAVPTGLQKEVGPQGIIDYLTERIDTIMGSNERNR